MPGIKGTRVDYSEKGPAGKDKRTGDDPQDASVSSYTQAKLKVGKSENEKTSETAKAALATRPNSGGK